MASVHTYPANPDNFESVLQIGRLRDEAKERLRRRLLSRCAVENNKSATNPISETEEIFEFGN